MDDRYDLHTHSTASDGTDTPAALVAAAAAAGLTGIAITDHDTTAGWAAWRATSGRAGTAGTAGTAGPSGTAGRAGPSGTAGTSGAPCEVLLGAELTCRDPDGARAHLLAYRFDPDHPDLAALMAASRAGRGPRLQRIVGRLVAAGIPITAEQVAAHTPAGAVPGRPHIADALVAAGVVADRSAAFAAYLHDGSPFYEPHPCPTTAAAIAAVRAAGGVTVIAHARGRRMHGRWTDARLAELAAAGLAGVEVDHPEHVPEVRRDLLRLAERLDLVPTGGSDYHGTGKPQPLGADSTPAATARDLLARAGAH